MRDHVPDPAARVGHVATVARDQVDVGVHHRLPGEDAAVHAHVEAIRPVPQLQNFPGFPDKIETRAVLLVAQVAISVAVLPIAQMGTRAFLSLAFTDFASPITSYTVIAKPQLDQSADAFTPTGEVRRARRTRYLSSLDELERRLEEGGGVRVLWMSASPDEENHMQIEVDTAQVSDTAWKFGPTVRIANVGADYFEAFDIRLLAGRTFIENDSSLGAHNIATSLRFTSDDGEDVVHACTP